MPSVTNGRFIAILVALLFVVTVGTGAATAQENAGEMGAEGELLSASGWMAIGFLFTGTIILIVSVELLIHALIRTALRFGVSTFLLAVVFSGWEFDNIAIGVFTGFAEMQNVAFGLAIGNAISIFGLTLALGAISFPFVVDVPDDYLAMTAGAPLLLVPVLISGSLTPVLSIMFIVVYVIIFAYIIQRERMLNRTFIQSDEVKEATTATDGEGEMVRYLPDSIRDMTRSGWFWPLMLVVAIGGIVVGAETSTAGIEAVLSTWDLTGTFVGVTLVTILYTIDDLLLILEPLRLGYADIAVGGVIGSLLFFVTANVGIIGLVGTINFRGTSVFVHLPALISFAALSAYMLWRGKMTRRRGALLLGLYLSYLLINIRFFATVPLGA